MRRRRIALWVSTIATLFALLAYLRDPPWLLAVSSGLHPSETDARGTRYRRMGAHASFFVPSDARILEIPIRVPAADADWPIVAFVTIDDRPADRLVLADHEWHRSILRLPSPSGRRVRRIDIRLERVRDDREAQLGDVGIR